MLSSRLVLQESILYESETEEFFENLPKAVELTILSLPEGINEHRDLGKTYDALEAYEILKQQQIIKYPLEFSEELPYADGVFTYEGREKLFSRNFVLLELSASLQFMQVIHLY